MENFLLKKMKKNQEKILSGKKIQKYRYDLLQNEQIERDNQWYIKRLQFYENLYGEEQAKEIVNREYEKDLKRRLKKNKK